MSYFCLSARKMLWHCYVPLVSNEGLILMKSRKLLPQPICGHILSDKEASSLDFGETISHKENILCMGCLSQVLPVLPESEQNEISQILEL